MGEYKTRPVTDAEYKDIIGTIRAGFTDTWNRIHEPHPEIALALELEGNLGIRISDIVKLHLSDIVKDGNKYRLNITEKKTGKPRTFSVPNPIYDLVFSFCNERDIKPDEPIFCMSTRWVQKILSECTEYLGLKDVSTHSFRKYISVNLYEQSGNDVMVVRDFLQHASVTTTMAYLDRSRDKVNKTLDKCVRIV